MRILLIDDEIPALSLLRDTVKSLVDEDTEILAFSDVDEYYDYDGDKRLDVAFLDIELGRMTGIQFAFEIKKTSPMCNIIFVTSYSEYGADAFTARPSGYVLKPFEPADIKKELENLRYPVKDEDDDKKLVVKTFGNFVVYRDDHEILEFSRTKGKEVFAYLIDCAGYPVTTNDICRDVFEEDFSIPASKRLSKIVLSLIDDVRNAGYTDIIIRQNRQITVNKGRISCDLYDALSGDTVALNSYRGDYMIDYSWAELSNTIKELGEGGY